MKYRTTIEVVTDAKTRTEAMEIVDDYLSGNIISGIDMKCTTRPAHAKGARMISVAVLSALLAVGVLAFMSAGPSSRPGSYGTAVSAVQPSLKTSSHDMSGSCFKDEWERKHTASALELIKSMK